jgi:D-alanyl-D-alanine carboxypeptidase
MHKLIQKDLDTYLTKAIKNKHIYGFSIDVEKDGKHLSSSIGILKEKSRFFIASTTKMFVCAIIMHMQSKDLLSLSDTITKYLDQDTLHGLHIYKSVEYTQQITIKHLLSNTSGLADYFNKELIEELTSNIDQSWDYKQVIAKSKHIGAKFKPGHKRKTHYSDTNFRLLQMIIEHVYKQSFKDVLNTLIIHPLELKETYLYQGEPDDQLAPMYFKSVPLNLPIYMASIGAEGGIVSTAKELNLFLKAFFTGKFFPVELLPNLYDWKLMIGPSFFYYGIGITNQPISFKNFKKGMFGHWGQSGAFAFYHPEKEVYLSGSANQFYGHQVAAKVMLNILKHF